MSITINEENHIASQRWQEPKKTKSPLGKERSSPKGEESFF